MIIETERLILKKLILKDVDSLVKIGNDYDIHYNSFFLMKFPFGKKEAEEVINEKNKNMERFGIFLKDKTLIGLIDLYNIKIGTPALHSCHHSKSSRVEGRLKVGYWIGKEYRKKGYATEALKKIIFYAFENFDINEIIASVLVNNEISIKLLKKVGFKQKRILKNDRFLEGKYIDSIQFVLNR